VPLEPSVVAIHSSVKRKEALGDLLHRLVGMLHASKRDSTCSEGPAEEMKVVEAHVSGREVMKREG